MVRKVVAPASISVRRAVPRAAKAKRRAMAPWSAVGAASGAGMSVSPRFAGRITWCGGEGRAALIYSLPRRRPGPGWEGRGNEAGAHSWMSPNWVPAPAGEAEEGGREAGRGTLLLPRLAFRAALTADLDEPGGHEARHAFLDRGEIVRLAQAAGQAVDAAGARHGQHERARDEVITPEDILFRAIGQRLFEDADQAQHDGIEMVVHHRRAPFGGVADLRA